MNISWPEVILSFLITWAVVLAPPLLIRAIRKTPINKAISILLCVVLYFANVVLFTALGSQSKSHAALLLGAWVSYHIFRREQKRALKMAPLKFHHNPDFLNAEHELSHYVSLRSQEKITAEEFEKHKIRIMGSNA